jgi:hypothetical protein
MSEAELWGLIVEYNDSLMAAMSLYLTILSGYLIVAYLAGGKLTSTQCTIITIAFVLSALLFTWAVRGYGYRAIFLIGKTSQEFHTWQMMDEPSLLFILAIMVGGVIAALKFMWDVRHPKAS